MRPTVEFVQHHFDEWNQRCFHNSLPPIPIKLVNSRCTLGAIVTQRHHSLFENVKSEVKYMRISTHFDLSESEIIDIIIHEMIHYYIIYHHLPDTSSHGRLFRRMMHQINDAHHRHISVSTHLTEADEERKLRLQENRLHIVCISHLNGGKLGVTVCAKTRVDELNRLLPKYYHLESMQWFFSIDTLFNRFPVSRTPKIYHITSQELSQCELKPIVFKK